MTDRQKLELAAAKARRELRALALQDDATAEQIAEATAKVDNLEARAAALPEDEPPTPTDPANLNDGEGREFRALEGRVEVRRYIGAVMDEALGVDGAEAEYNAALKMGPGRFPLRLLAPREVRTTTDVDAGARQGTWVDRLFADTMAARLGITMPSVAPGVSAYPVTTAGASAAQRGRSESAADAAWTVGVTELKASRNSVRAVFSVEDAARLVGLEDALRRDLRMALAEGIDRAIFKGDAGANEDRADITGLTGITAAATGLQEKTLTQANKVKAGKTLEAFVSLIDGKHAATMADLNIVATVGAATLWEGTILAISGESASVFKTLAGFLRNAGLSWGVRGDLETATSNGKFGAFIGRKRGIAGAGVAPVWEAAKLVRDPYTRAEDGEIAMTLHTLWAFGLPRPSNFARLKFVT